MRFVTLSVSFRDLKWMGRQDSFLFFFSVLRGNEGLCKQWVHAFYAHNTSTHVWSASTQHNFFSLLRLTFYTFCSILQQQLSTRKKEFRISRLLLQRKNSVDKGCTLNVPTRFIHCFCFLYSPLLNFLKHFFCKGWREKRVAYNSWMNMDDQIWSISQFVSLSGWHICSARLWSNSWIDKVIEWD